MGASEKLKTDNLRKRLGLGSISLLLFVIGLLFSFSFGKHGALGDTILRFVGLNPWSNGETGLHYTMFYSLIFYIPAWIIGNKFKSDLGAKTGKILSVIMIVLTLLFSLFIIA
ncbi:hypothetical protein F7731_12720 [Cytobacillus depressus]|uniref:Uncharacterized protein n=1 Tax=Cytobacillus depressus TaxID=1602942 RepID=A0A6L3V7W0_9BACI|nr:hypothetical protein [Cytobacillus depressus]KAB2336340.1 hypothetical protein F7731_12720 [Cytobacillus depressus]